MNRRDLITAVAAMPIGITSLLNRKPPRPCADGGVSDAPAWRDPRQVWMKDGVLYITDVDAKTSFVNFSSAPLVIFGDAYGDIWITEGALPSGDRYSRTVVMKNGEPRMFHKQNQGVEFYDSEVVLYDAFGDRFAFDVNRIITAKRLPKRPSQTTTVSISLMNPRRKWDMPEVV